MVKEVYVTSCTSHASLHCSEERVWRWQTNGGRAQPGASARPPARRNLKRAGCRVPLPATTYAYGSTREGIRNCIGCGPSRAIASIAPHGGNSQVSMTRMLGNVNSEHAANTDSKATQIPTSTTSYAFPDVHPQSRLVLRTFTPCDITRVVLDVTVTDGLALGCVWPLAVQIRAGDSVYVGPPASRLPR